jgi:hypothetical protein
MHKKNVTRSERAILAAVLSLAGGCQLAQMQVSQPLDAVPAVPVDGPLVRKWSDPIRFGAWHTTSVDEGQTDWRPGRAAANPELSVHKLSLERIYRLALVGTGAAIRAACLARLDAATYGHTTFDVGAAHGEPPLQCTYDGATTGSLELFDVITRGDSLAGHVDFDDVHWNIQSVDRLAGSRSRGAIVGYEIRNDEIVIGAVQTINRPQVWIASSLTPLEQDRVATVVATLLLYRPLQEDLEAEQLR